jgi:hypothetical protein
VPSYQQEFHNFKDEDTTELEFEPLELTFQVSLQHSSSSSDECQ